MELTKRQYEIIRHIPRKGYKSASQLSEEILVSEKTIRNEIAVINALFEAPPLIESHKSKGYCLNLDNQNYNFIFSEKYQYNDDSFQRQMEILRILLRNQEVSVMELCDALYIGEKRLRYDIHRINEVIKERHAEITVLWKDATLKIVGGG